LLVTDKKSLNIPNGQSESVSRRTDNTMAKRKKDKRTKKHDLQNITQKTSSNTNSSKRRGWTQVLYQCFLYQCLCMHVL